MRCMTTAALSSAVSPTARPPSFQAACPPDRRLCRILLMAEENNVISTIRLARWLMLALLLVGGIVLYFGNGTKLPPFGSVEPSVETDTTR
jgi:hypothetical protein